MRTFETSANPSMLTIRSASLLLACGLSAGLASWSLAHPVATAQSTPPATTAPSDKPAAPPATKPAEKPAEGATSEVRIDRLLTGDTVLVASVDKWSDFEARVRRTPLWGLWETKEVQDALAKLYEQQTGGEDEGASFDKALEEMGLTRDKLVAPEGTVAFGLFLEMNEEIGQKQPQVLMLADFGSKADKAEEMFGAVISKMEERGAKVEEKEIRGRKVQSIPLPEDAKEEGMEDEDDMGGFGAPPDPTELMEHISTMHLCRDKERFMMSSSLVALEDALEVVDGQKPSAPLEADEDFQKATRQLGDRQAWAVLLTRPIQPLLAQIGGGEMAMMSPILSKLVGDIRAFSYGLAVDGKDGMAEQTVGILVPGGKVGLLSLLESKPRGGLPRHVGPDAIGYGRMNIRFAGVMPLLKEVVKSVPPPFADQIEMQLEQFGPVLEKAMADLGPEMHVTTALTEPLTAESQHESYAIRAERPDGVKPMLDMFAPMTGLAPQDFLGNTIWADEFAPMAVGLGGGWLVVGDQASVEGVLRSAGQKDLASLGEDASFKRSFATVPDGDLVGWGWKNMVAQFAFDKVQTKAQMEELKQILGEEGAAEFEADGLTEVLDKITPELLGKHIGPSSWYMKSVDDGFVYRWTLLAPE